MDINSRWYVINLYYSKKYLLFHPNAKNEQIAISSNVFSYLQVKLLFWHQTWVINYTYYCKLVACYTTKNSRSSFSVNHNNFNICLD